MALCRASLVILFVGVLLLNLMAVVWTPAAKLKFGVLPSLRRRLRAEFGGVYEPENSNVIYQKNTF
jgi:hypothetical protein